MRAYRISLALFGVALVALVALALWSWPRRVDERAHDVYAERLGRIETLVHRLHEQVLRAHAGLAGSYDPIVQTVRELRDVHRAVADVPAFLDRASRERVSEALRSSTEVLEHDADLIERFKTENAILLNSLRFFPVAAAEASERLAFTVGSEASGAELRDLLRDVLRLVVTPTDDARAEVRRHLAVLRAASIDEDLALLLRHADVITQRRAMVDRLLREILEQPAIEHARALGEAYEGGHSIAVERAASHRLAAFVLALVVVLLGASTIILRLQASAAELARASERLAHAVDAQNRFVSMTSHEFRTPLSVIVSSAEMLDAYGERWSIENRHKHLRRIDRAARGMTDLLDGLLLIGRTDAGHREFRAADVDLDALVVESLEAQRARAKDGVTVGLTSTGTGSRVRLDPRLLRHVLDNLVSNAVKYSKPGGKVSVRVASERNELTLAVADHGIGIPPEHLGRLFDTFSRAKNVGSVQGTGLGLAIVKRAVDQHSGRIEATSEVGVGTKFVVRIPIEPPLDAGSETVGA